VVEGGLQRIGAQLAHLGADAGEFGSHHVDLRELFPGEIVGDQDIAVRGRRRGVLKQCALLGVGEAQQAADALNDVADLLPLGLRVTTLAGDFGAQRDVEIPLRAGERAASAIIDRAAVRRRGLELDAHFARLGLELLLTEKLQLGEARGEAREHDAAGAEEDDPARGEQIFPVAVHRLATRMLAGRIKKRTGRYSSAVIMKSPVRALRANPG
jgi:hypothetical protein